MLPSQLLHVLAQFTNASIGLVSQSSGEQPDRLSVQRLGAPIIITTSTKEFRMYYKQ